MPNRLSDAVSPYLLSHADNPVDWQPWGEAAFAEAAARDVPVLVSIGYSTCHWCHVMARESFSDPAIAATLNAGFVAIKVDREEHPDVDASYLAAAGAFSEHLGWPLNVFVTPQGRAFFAGTYWPPTPVNGSPAFREVLAAVTDAWTVRRSEVETNADAVVAALPSSTSSRGSALPTSDELTTAVSELLEYEDSAHGGFGGAPKFPVAPVLGFLLERGSVGDMAALGLASRTLRAMAASDLRDPVEGGFFRYATRRDWSEPHYERMLYDNALLLGCYAKLDVLEPGSGRVAAEGIASFLLSVMRLPGGGFASAQDSESTVDGARVEGGYYALTAAERADQVAPALDAKVLTGWNGLAIEALADAGFALSRPDWVAAAAEVADLVVERHLRSDGTLLRASIGTAVSSARSTLEDHGMLTAGLLAVARATGDSRHAIVARGLVDGALTAARQNGAEAPFAVPGGADPVLAAQGIAIDADPSEGAYPSGLSAMASASLQLYLITGFSRYREAAARAMELVAPLGVKRPMAFGTALAVTTALDQPISQLIVVANDSGSPLASVARGFVRSGSVSTVVSVDQAAQFAENGFGVFGGRVREAGYLCHHFVCRLPLTDAVELSAELALEGSTDSPSE